MRVIKGKIAELLDERRIVINRGSENGVLLGMYFQIFSPETTTIKDPDSGAQLGSAMIPIMQVQVVHVDAKFCVAATFRSKTVNAGGFDSFGDVLSKMTQPPKYIKVHETFELDSEQAKKLEEARSKVKLGYPVESISADDKDLLKIK